MNKITFFAALYCVFIAAFVWGIATATFRVFPWTYVQPIIADVMAFYVSHPDEPETTVMQRLASDMGGIPYRYVQEAGTAYASSISGGEAFSVLVDDIHLRGRHDAAPDGYLAVFGAFRFGDGRNLGTILLKTDGSLVGGWATRKGLNVEPEIDIERGWIFQGNGHFVDWGCDFDDLGRELVQHTLLEEAHHSVALSPDGTYWTHDAAFLVELGYRGTQADPSQPITPEDFEELRRFDLATDLVAATPDISPLTGRFILTWDEKSDPQKTKPVVRMTTDPFHNNDVDPIVSSRFETDAGYALLTSVRELNLVVVFNPDNGEILWYRQGLTERQHDADYFDDGVYVYNNRPFKDFSRIDYIPFESSGGQNHGLTTIIDGKDYAWFDPSRGQHDVFEHGGQRYNLVVNDRNGRVMLFDEAGEMNFELVNLLGEDPESTERLQVRAAKFITQEQFDALTAECPAQG